MDHQAFRGALSRFASGVTVVSTVVDGIEHAMTASAFTSVSLEPPMVLVCSDRRSRFHDEAPDDPLLYYRSHYGTIVRSAESEKTILETRT